MTAVPQSRPQLMDAAVAFLLGLHRWAVPPSGVRRHRRTTSRCSGIVASLAQLAASASRGCQHQRQRTPPEILVFGARVLTRLSATTSMAGAIDVISLGDGDGERDGQRRDDGQVARVNR